MMYLDSSGTKSITIGSSVTTTTDSWDTPWEYEFANGSNFTSINPNNTIYVTTPNTQELKFYQIDRAYKSTIQWTWDVDLDDKEELIPDCHEDPLLGRILEAEDERG
jgi:hypothetical protein